MTDSRVCFLAQAKTARTHLSYFINWVARLIFRVGLSVSRPAVTRGTFDLSEREEPFF